MCATYVSPIGVGAGLCEGEYVFDPQSMQAATVNTIVLWACE